MFFSILLFFAGFYILVKGANFLIDGASSLAKKFNVSPFVIGLVIVGIGTSIPEFAISFIANIAGKNEIALGTIIGSNIFNIFFILGLTALFFPLAMKKKWVERDMTWNIIAVLAVILLAIPFNGGIISRPEGILMLLLFFYWLYQVIEKSDGQDEEQFQIKEFAFPIATGLILAGFAGVFLGGKWVVDGAVVIARELGMGEALIGLTIVGIGTSLPELAASFAAAWKKQTSIVVGSIIGSNIFDFLMILGVSAVIKPIKFPLHLSFDVIIALIAVLLLYQAVFVGEKYVFKRWQGLIFASLYIIYAIYIISI